MYCRNEVPRVEILEQPAAKSFRFRYECEGRCAGSILGASHTADKPTFPSILVSGYQGRAVVIVSCVSKDAPYKPHPHKITGRKGCKKGVCTLEIPQETMYLVFTNLGIQCCKRKDIQESLKAREEIKVDPFKTGFEHAKDLFKIDLSAVRLCFQVFVQDECTGRFTIPLEPIVSDIIYDKRCKDTLIIVKLSHCNALVDGGRNDIILVCEKVTKEDIKIRFFEQIHEGHLIWEDFGRFDPKTQVYKQINIFFKPPKYHRIDIVTPVRVFIQLLRPSDGATSTPLPFEYLPLQTGKDLERLIGCKRPRMEDEISIWSGISDNTRNTSSITPHHMNIPNSYLQHLDDSIERYKDKNTLSHGNPHQINQPVDIYNPRFTPSFQYMYPFPQHVNLHQNPMKNQHCNNNWNILPNQTLDNVASINNDCNFNEKLEVATIVDMSVVDLEANQLSDTLQTFLSLTENIEDKSN